MAAKEVDESSDSGGEHAQNQEEANQGTVAAGAEGNTSRPEVTTKYNSAAVICNEVLQKVIELCKPDADIAEICRQGDALIEEKCHKVYNKKEKGESVSRVLVYTMCIR